MTAWHKIHALDIGTKLLESDRADEALLNVSISCIGSDLLVVLGIRGIPVLHLKLDIHDIAQRFDAPTKELLAFRLGTDTLDLVAGQQET